MTVKTTSLPKGSATNKLQTKKGEGCSALIKGIFTDPLNRLAIQTATRDKYEINQGAYYYLPINRNNRDLLINEKKRAIDEFNNEVDV